MRVFALSLPLLLAACASLPDDDVRRFEAELDRLSAARWKAAEKPAADLAGELDLDLLVRIARAENPELREQAGRARAQREAARRDGAYDDPTLRVRTERALSENRARENALGVEQRIPFPGKLGLAAEAGLREAESLVQTALARERDVVARVKRAYYELYAARKELETHREHIRLLQELEQVSDSRFRTGVVSQQDVLKPQVEIVLLQTDVLAAQQRIASAQATLNALLGRPATAPLGPAREPAAPAEPPGDVGSLAAAAAQRHPDVLAQRLRTRAVEAGLELARREAILPDVSVGAEYMQMPGEPDAWAGMVGIHLPWLTGKRRAEARRREELLRAEEAALEAVRLRLQADVRDAHARAEATGRALRLLRDELLPKSIQTVDVSRAAYQQGRLTFLELLDAERSLRDVRLRHYQAQSMHGSALADLERASGFEPGRNP